MAQGEFITTWKTDNSGVSNSNEITIPTGSGTFNYTVDWGDGSSSTHTGDATHTYATPGTYTVKISGAFPHLNFSGVKDNLKLLSVEQWGDQVWGSMEYSFYDCDKVVFNATDVPDLSQVTTMEGMFMRAGNFNQDIGNWDVGNVVNMKDLFYNANRFNQDISGWDVGNVTNMVRMFWSTNDFNQDISGWNVAKVTDMYQMFMTAAAFNQDLSAWNVSQVTRMTNMFEDAGLSNDNYDKLLLGWSARTLKSNVAFGASNTYCMGAAGRDKLIMTYGWNITDAGKDYTTACEEQYFITKWDTRIAGKTASNRIEIPIGDGAFNYFVDWGDGQGSRHSGTATHTYSTSGIKTIKISGNFPHLKFASTGLDNNKLLSVEQWGSQVWGSMESMFMGCSNMRVNATMCPIFLK